MLDPSPSTLVSANSTNNPLEALVCTRTTRLETGCQTETVPSFSIPTQPGHIPHQSCPVIALQISSTKSTRRPSHPYAFMSAACVD